MITTATGVKTAVNTTGVIFSVGLGTVGMSQENTFYLILGVIGLIVSLMNYHYIFEHDKNADKIFISDIIQHMLLGFITLPVMYLGFGYALDNTIIRLGMSAIFAYYSVNWITAAMKGLVTWLSEYKWFSFLKKGE